MRWQCNGIQASEAFPIFQKPYLQVQGRILETNTSARPQDENEKKQEALDYRYRTVEEFMTLDISFPDDRLPAIAGLAKILAERTGYRYVCGLWKEDLLTGVFWSVRREEDGVEGSKVPPSWSWVRLPTLPTFPLIHLAVKEQMFRRARASESVPGFDAEVLDIKVENVDDDIYGEVEAITSTLHFPLLFYQEKWHPNQIRISPDTLSSFPPQFTAKQPTQPWMRASLWTRDLFAG
jgi:hypothetical protein